MFLLYLFIFTLAFVFVLPRIVTPIAPRVWFALSGLPVMIFLSVSAYVVDKLRMVGVPVTTTQGIVNVLCMSTFWMWVHLNPQISVEEVGSTAQFADIQKGSYLLINHVSFFDALAITSRFSTPFAFLVRSIFKSSLAKLPLMGPVFKRAGHFPVYFKSSERADFSVDREKQDGVVKRLETFVESQTGCVAMCPEGAMNPNPENLMPFRHGSFALILKYKIPLFGLVHCGCNEVWPLKISMGGFPATVKWCMFAIPVDYTREDLTAAVLAEEIRTLMQKKLEALRAA